MRRYREGDFLETVGGLIFEVKGLLHPPDRVIAFLRYVPSPIGDRRKGKKRYRKIYSLQGRYGYLKENNPEYLWYDENMRRLIQSVAFEDIEQEYKPEKRLKELAAGKRTGALENAAFSMCEEIADESGVSMNRMGVTGSILVGLHRKGSDVDLVVYGAREGIEVHSALKRLRGKGGSIQPYDDQYAMKISEFRWGRTDLPLEDLSVIEKEKILQGLVEGIDYFVRLVEGWGDIKYSYGDLAYEPIGHETIEAIVSDDAQSIFTPNRYKIEGCRTLVAKTMKIEELFSFRGRFAEQARVGDRVRARGKVERVVFKRRKEDLRMILEEPTDYLVPLEH